MDNKLIDGTCLTLQSIFTIAQTNEVFRIISLILTILSACVVLSKNIYEWYIEARKDGKIDKDEVKDIIDIVDKGITDVKDIIDNKEDKD